MLSDILQIISFGAGFDTSYFTLRQQGHSQIQYVEIDFQDVVTKKRQLIKNHPYCAELAAEKDTIYHLVATDLRNLPSLTNLLFEKISLSPSEPTLFISECAITYMDECRYTLLNNSF